MLRLFLIATLLTFTPSYLLAQTKTKKAPSQAPQDVQQKNKAAPAQPVAKASEGSNPQSLTLIYASSPWNKDSAKIDSAFIFLKDSKSDKIAKILLDETEPDSSTFSGTFSLDFPLDEDARPEIYIPPQKLRHFNANCRKFTTS